MKRQFNYLRVKQLTRSLEPFLALRGINDKPSKGWLSALRKVSGLTLRSLASRLDVNHQTLAALEKSEAEERITLKRLREVADAMNCQLIYAVVPKQGTIQEFAEAEIRNEAKARVHAVEHSMALEAQQSGGVQEKIDEETARLLADD